MKPNCLWCFFIILLNQETLIVNQEIAAKDELLYCHETDERPCYQRPDLVDQGNRKINQRGMFECIRDASEPKKSCGLPTYYVCGKVEILFDDGDKVIFTGCDRKDKLKLCDKRSNPDENIKWEKRFGKKFKKRNCVTCEESMCNSKNPVTKEPKVTSPSPPSQLKKEQKSENSGVSPNVALLILLVLLIRLSF